MKVESRLFASPKCNGIAPFNLFEMRYNHFKFTKLNSSNGIIPTKFALVESM